MDLSQKSKGLKRIPIAFSIFFLSILFLGMMGLPAMASYWKEKILLSTTVSRPIMEGQLTSQAQEIPVVYGLYCKRILSGSEISGAIQKTDPEGLSSNQVQRLKELEEAGALPETAMEQALKIYQFPGTKAYTLDQDGITALIYHGYDQNDYAQSVMVEEHGKTGLVTSCSITGVTSPGQPMSLLDAYKTYLGLDQLTDWKSCQLEESAICWSMEGQIYLSCTFQNQRFYIGAVSLPREQLASVEEKFSDSLK